MEHRRIALVLVLTGGCTAPLTAPATDSIVAEGISITARVEALETTDAFLTVLNVQEVAADGTLSTRAMPRVLVRAGQEAKLELTGEGGEPTLRALVQIPALDELEQGARIDVQVFQGDELIAAPSIIVDMPPPDAAAGRPIPGVFEDETSAPAASFRRRCGTP